MGRGSTNGDESQFVKVPRVGLFEKEERTGAYGFWVGDAGVKANVAVHSHHDPKASPENFFAHLGGVGPEVSGIENVGDRAYLEEDTKPRLISNQSLDLVHASGAEWRRENFHSVTVHSQGVLANVRESGLRKNLSVFLNTEEDIEPITDGGELLIAGLSAQDHLVGPLNEEDFSCPIALRGVRRT